MSKKKRRKAALMPPRGPATNLRPAGAHESLVAYNRKRNKHSLREELDQESPGYDQEVD